MDMAHRLGLEILAEGIEETEQRDYFIGLDCREGQGFYFAKPMPANELIQLLKEQKDSY